MSMFAVLFVCATIYGSASANLVPFITPCHASDNECLKASAQRALSTLVAGVPSLGVDRMDPLKIDRVQTDQAGLSMDFRDTIVRGLRNCEVMSLRHRETKIKLDLKCSVTLIGNYTLGGKLLVFPIEGNGKYKIKIRDIVVKISFDAPGHRVNGVQYWQLTNSKHTADVLTGVEFQFQNLFNGNKQLSDTIHEFANSNWRDIFHEVAPPIVDAIVQRVLQEIRKLFHGVPVKQMDLDTNEW